MVSPRRSSNSSFPIPNWRQLPDSPLHQSFQQGAQSILPPSSSVGPPMSRSQSMHRRIKCTVTKDGLVLHPVPILPVNDTLLIGSAGDPGSSPKAKRSGRQHLHNSKSALVYSGPAVRIGWGRSAVVVPLDEWSTIPLDDINIATQEDQSSIEAAKKADNLEAIGIAGLLRGYHSSFLLLIIESSVCATYFDEDPRQQIHTIVSLVAIPLDGEIEAKAAIAKHVLKGASVASKKAFSKAGAASSSPSHPSSDTDSDEKEDDEDDEDEDDDVENAVTDPETDMFASDGDDNDVDDGDDGDAKTVTTTPFQKKTIPEADASSVMTMSSTASDPIKGSNARILRGKIDQAMMEFKGKPFWKTMGGVDVLAGSKNMFAGINLKMGPTKVATPRSSQDSGLKPLRLGKGTSLDTEPIQSIKNDRRTVGVVATSKILPGDVVLPVDYPAKRQSINGSSMEQGAATSAKSPEEIDTASDKIEKGLITNRKVLDAKIVKEVIGQLKGMYFSFFMDITRSLQKKREAAGGGGEGVVGSVSQYSTSLVEDESVAASLPKTRNEHSKASTNVLIESNPNLPLWRRADRRFWWNHHLMQPFIEAGCHPYIIVLQQGFVRQTSVEVPLENYASAALLSSSPSSPPTPSVHPVLSPSSASLALEEKSILIQLVIISRRSIERPGLRYRRRGVNVNGGVANFVETELLTGIERDGRSHVSSFVQTRGSIPVFWSQSPWALKPPPILERTAEDRFVALKKHFKDQTNWYGNVTCVNLAETAGKEAVVVTEYEEQVKKMNEESEGFEKGTVKYVGFDFHLECRGMRYGNISKLIDKIEPDLEHYQSFWATSGGQVFSTQSGVIRTNCIDCLDRTNVVQCAISRWVLNRQLVHLAIASSSEGGLHDKLDLAFNGLWADNGDSISREYAGSSALKGDFTRTGKRDWRGAMHDATSSVTRMLRNTVSDFFSQACIDYVLGANLNAFAEFQERLDSSDPGELLRLSHVRQEAIETCTAIALSDGEERLAGWTLLSPSEPNTLRSLKFEEKVMLLSSQAVYVASYDYTLQKVTEFLRIPLKSITGIQHGAYILSALDAAARDVTQNYGFLIRYLPEWTTGRVHTYSMRVQPDAKLSSPVADLTAMTAGNDPKVIQYCAFKALRSNTSLRGGVSGDGSANPMLEMKPESSQDATARDAVQGIVGMIQECCEQVEGIGQDGIEAEDLISLVDARAQTGIIDKLNKGIKSMIWG